jgi:hypothetical protein
LVTLVRKRTVAKVDSIVIWSPSCGVVDVRHGVLRSPVLRRGRGYLQSSRRQSLWRDDAPHLVALVRAGARFENGKLVERPDGTTTKEAAA